MLTDQRRFGFLFSAIFLTLAGLKSHWAGELRIGLAAGGSLLLIITVIAPAWLTRPLHLWLLFGERLQKFTQPIVLGVLYVCILSPLGWLRKLTRTSKLQTDFSQLDSYWIAISNSSATEPDQLKRQF